MKPITLVIAVLGYCAQYIGMSYLGIGFGAGMLTGVILLVAIWRSV